MEKCPKCGKWMLSYWAVREQNECQGCGYTEHESYNHYLKRTDVSEALFRGNRLLACKQPEVKE